MSDIPPVSPPKKTGYRWLLILVSLFCALPILMIVALVGYFAVRSSASSPNAIPAQAARPFDVEHVQTPVPGTPAMPPSTTPWVPAAPVADDPKKRAQLVRIQLDFEDFETRFANGITIDRSGQGSRLLVPSAVFAPMKGKINGRMVTRNAGVPGLIEIGPEKMTGPAMVGMGAMPGMGMGAAIPGSNLSVVREIPEIGLTELLLSNWELTPVRVVGDFPEASIGDKLMVVSLSPALGTQSEVTVLGVDESVQLGEGPKVDHLLKLTEWTGTSGALIYNSAGDPVGQIIYTQPGKLRYSYAVPMGRIFQAIYDQRPNVDSDHPKEPSFSDFPGAPQSPLASDKGSEAPPNVPLPNANSIQNSPPPFDDLVAPKASLSSASPGPADASRPEQSDDRVAQVYQVLGLAQDAAETVRSLYSDVAKIAVDRGSRSIIAIASPSVQEKIATTIKEMNTRTQNFQDEQAKNAKQQKELEAAEAVNQRRRMDAENEDLEARMALEEVEHRKNPKRTRLIKVTGRDPKEVAKILSTLFGQTADVALDERTGSVLITINRAKTWAEVQFLLGEIEGTAARLEQESSTSATLSPPTPTDALMIGPVIADATPRNALYSEQDREARQFALQLRTAAQADRAGLRTKLERLTEQQFQTRQKLRKQEIDDLGKRIDQLRVTHLRRQQNQAEIIRRRVEELLDPNNDLRWEQSQSTAEPPTEVQAADPTEKALDTVKTEVPAPASVERTFDGIPYSQWMKMLETERKPAKLAAAMEASSRLAVAADTRRIAKETILNASLFENGDESEQAVVWNAADSALARLPVNDVTDELLASLAEPESAKRGRTFQGRFLLNHVRGADRSLMDRSQELVAALVKAVQESGKDRNCLLAAACQLWQVSGQPLQAFEGLRPLIMERFDSAADTSLMLDNDWYMVALALVTKNPETPDLAIKLMKYSARDVDFVRMLQLVGQLGRHAEPAVPAIIEQILAELKKLESADDDSTVARVLPANVARSKKEQRVIQLVRTLGSIGVGDKAATLLKELNLIANPYSLNTTPYAISREAQQALAGFAQIPNTDVPPILGDEFLVRGNWQLQSLNFEKLAGYEAWIDRGSISLSRLRNGDRSELPQVINGHLVGGPLKVDSTKAVKEIVISNRRSPDLEVKRHGIYELTATTFKIYLAPLDQPAPTEMIEEGSAIPDGYSRVEWRRSLSIPPNP
eukprot:TRINITY_DN1274_c0_g1_i4.p1 TRINITY_DN1274_c0_g1~~TRINITY_DN1274_c0_g1_i4.p1  ORF type:complete len:1204 (-),score=247.36 TRINITY_DN1274_c0_g1_i4:191-3802(-)